MPGPQLQLTGRIAFTGKSLSRVDLRDWLARVAVWFETVGDTVLDAQLDQSRADDLPLLYVTIHPAASDVELQLAADGTVSVFAETFPAGPGYHAHLVGMLIALADDFDLNWVRADDPTGFFRRADVGELNRCFLDGLGRKCRHFACQTEEWLGEPIPLGLPVDHGFTHPGPILTPNGPRSMSWLNSVAAEPKSGRDFFPWWRPERDAVFYRNRATTMMWCDYPWRPPVTEEEAELTDQIAADLATAHTLDPKLKMPWRAWAEVAAAITADNHHLTIEPINDTLAKEIQSRAAAMDGYMPLIGYRRHPVRVQVGEGWSVLVPGSFAERWDDENRTWHAWEQDRRIALCFTGEHPEGTSDLMRCGEKLWCRVEGGDPHWAEAVRESIRQDAA